MGIQGRSLKAGDSRLIKNTKEKGRGQQIKLENKRPVSEQQILLHFCFSLVFPILILAESIFVRVRLCSFESSPCLSRETMSVNKEQQIQWEEMKDYQNHQTCFALYVTFFLQCSQVFSLPILASLAQRRGKDKRKQYNAALLH